MAKPKNTNTVDSVATSKDITQKIQRMKMDHEAMNIFRKHNGDVKLTFFVVGGGIDVMLGKAKCQTGYDCNIFQETWSLSDADPAKAILKAYKRWKKAKNKSEGV